MLKASLLFPTIERMALSSQGRVVTPFLKYLHRLAKFPMYPIHYLLPDSVKEAMLKWYFRNRNTSDSAVQATKRLANPPTIRNVVYMANQEMQNVLDADYDLIHKYLDQLMFYYGNHDHWTPVEYYEEMKAKFPAGDIHLCKEGFDHAFVLDVHQARKVGSIVWEWLGRHMDLVIRRGANSGQG